MLVHHHDCYMPDALPHCGDKQMYLVAPDKLGCCIYLLLLAIIHYTWFTKKILNRFLGGSIEPLKLPFGTGLPWWLYSILNLMIVMSSNFYNCKHVWERWSNPSLLVGSEIWLWRAWIRPQVLRQQPSRVQWRSAPGRQQGYWTANGLQPRSIPSGYDSNRSAETDPPGTREGGNRAQMITGLMFH